MSTASAPKSGQQDTSASIKGGNPAALKINASAGPQKSDNKGAGQAEYRSMLTSQDTGSDFAASALADGPETPKAPLTDATKGQTASKSYFSRSTEQKQAPLPDLQAPLPDLPERQSYISSSQNTSKNTTKPINFTSTPSFGQAEASDAKAWVAHSDGHTDDIKVAPELKSALPAKVEQHLSERDNQSTVNKTPLAKDLAQAARAGQPVAWVAHKDGRLDDIDSVPALAEALPAKVSNKLTTPAKGNGGGGSGFFSKVLHGAVQVAKVAVVVGLTALATDKLQKEYVTRKESHGHGQDHPVQPLADRGLLGRKV